MGIESTETLKLETNKENFILSQKFAELVNNQEKLTKQDFDCNQDFATNFCSQFDEDKLVSLYETANYMQINELYKTLNTYIGSLYMGNFYCVDIVLLIKNRIHKVRY